MNSLPLLPALLLLTLAVPPLTKAETSPPATPTAVTVARTVEQDIPALIEVAGTLQAAERATIAAKISGLVTQVPVQLGSLVKAGDLLLTLSAEEISAKLNQAEAHLAQAKRNFEREQSLLQKNATTPETVRSMNDAFLIAQAGHREAKTMSGYLTITAPFSGVITRKQINSGDLATPGAILLQMENNQKLQVLVAAPESLVLGIRRGDSLAVTVPSANVVTRGTVAEIAPAADPGSRTAPVTIDLPADPALRTGQFARVLVPGQRSRSLLVPQAAIVSTGQMDRVFVVSNDRAQLRLVRTGLTREGMTEILSGLAPGETVVTGNNQLLVNGQPLRITP